MIYEAIDNLQATPNAFPLSCALSSGHTHLFTALLKQQGLHWCPVVMNLLGSAEDTQIQSLLQKDSTWLRTQGPQLLSLGPRA